MYEWLSAWVDTIHTNGLGPKIEWTIARQALLSLKRYAHTYDDGGLWWHDNHQLHRFEYATRREQSPIRIGANDAHYDRLYKLDFTAHYLSVLASCPMPGELVAYEPNGCTVADMQWILRHGLLVVADVRTSHGWRKMTTPEVANSDYDAVREMAAYRPTRLLAGWAANMYRIREECDPIIRQSIKALGVSLWGRLTARNYTFVPKSHIYEPGEETLYGLGPVTDGDMSYRFTDNGRYFECDPGAWHRERFHALGAHVMAYGRQRVERLMGLVEPVYCHTDSIWSLTPVTGTAAMPRGLGGVTQEIVHDVTFSAGVRYVGGVVDAAPGIPRRGSRRYQPHTDPELLDMDATAAFEIRR